jgi:hypothetical protein
MTVGELIENMVRPRLDDVNGPPYLVSDPQMIVYANEAQIEAAIRARLLVDSTTANVATISASANSWQYELDSRVAFVKRARFSSQSFNLKKRQTEWMDKCVPGWESHSAGTPVYYITDYETGLLCVYPKLETADTLKLTVVREPLNALELMEDEFELKPRHQYGLADWILHRCYAMPDADIHDTQKSFEHLALFEATYGKRTAAHDENYIHEHYDFEAGEGVY